MWQLTLQENLPMTARPHVGFKFSFSNFKTHIFGTISKATKLQHYVVIEMNKVSGKEITIVQGLKKWAKPFMEWKLIMYRNVEESGGKYSWPLLPNLFIS